MSIFKRVKGRKSWPRMVENDPQTKCKATKKGAKHYQGFNKLGRKMAKRIGVAK